MEAKGLRVNIDKTKFMTSGSGLNPLHNSGKYPCGVCCQGFALAITLSNARGASTGCTGDVPANEVGGLLQTLCFDVAGAWVLRGVYMYRQMRRFM